MTTEPRESKNDQPEAGAKSDPVAQVAAARAELSATLDALQDKVNVPKRIRTAAAENPIGLAAVGVGVAAAVGGAVWLVVRLIRSK